MDQVQTDRLVGASVLNSIDRGAMGPSLVLAIIGSVAHVVAEKLLREVMKAEGCTPRELDRVCKAALRHYGEQGCEAAMNMIATRLVDTIEAIRIEVQDIRRGAA